MDFGQPKLFEQNCISLREAVVFDNGDVAFFGLVPAWIDSSIPGVMPSFREIDRSRIEMATLYRHLRSAVEEKKLADGFFPSEKAVKALVFKTPPRFELFWSETGHDVALYLNGEAWAFVDGKSGLGYSKGLLKDWITKLWDQRLFEAIFGEGLIREL